MKLKFKALPGLQAWVISHQTDYFGLFNLGQSFMDPDVYYGGDGYPTEHTPLAAGWYSVGFFDDSEDSEDMYLTDPESYTEYLADCGIGSCMRGPFDSVEELNHCTAKAQYDKDDPGAVLAETFALVGQGEFEKATRLLEDHMSALP